MFRIIHVETVGSTQDLARSIKDAEEWTVVVADMQTGGRGRMRRSWISPKGGLWATIITYPRTPVRELTILSLLPALAITNILQKHGINPVIRWPNDIYVEEKKIAGVLVEVDATAQRIEKALIGIGINVNNIIDQFPDEIREKTTTLLELTGKETDLNQLLNAIIEEIKSIMVEYRQQGPKVIIDKIKRKLDILNKEIVIETRDGLYVNARVVDITETGGLCIIVNNNQTYYISQQEVNRIMKI